MISMPPSILSSEGEATQPKELARLSIISVASTTSRAFWRARRKFPSLSLSLPLTLFAR